MAGVAWASALPLDFFDSGGLSFEIVGDPPVDDSQRPATEYQVVSPTYFSTLDLPILAGRAFDRRDTRDGVPVCIVNEAFARSFQRPIADRPARGAAAGLVAAGESRSCARSSAWRRQVKGRPDEAKDFVQLYVPMAQDLSDDIFLVVRPKSGRAEALAPAVRAAISRVDKEQLVSVTRRHDARRHRVGGHRPPSLPRRDGGRLCGAGARPCDGRRVRNARLLGSAARA